MLQKLNMHHCHVWTLSGGGAFVQGGACPRGQMSGEATLWRGMAYGSQPAYASVTRWWQKLTIKLLTIIIVLVLLSSLTVQLKAEAYLNESTLQWCYLCIITHFHKIHSCMFLSCCKTLKRIHKHIFGAPEMDKWICGEKKQHTKIAEVIYTYCITADVRT